MFISWKVLLFFMTEKTLIRVSKEILKVLKEEKEKKGLSTYESLIWSLLLENEKFKKITNPSSFHKRMETGEGER